jgi:hypothetical protein
MDVLRLIVMIIIELLADKDRVIQQLEQKLHAQMNQRERAEVRL